jgi:hypothetical protein
MRKLLLRFPVERKGASNPYTSLNGHMFSRLIHPEDWLCAFLRTNVRNF